MAPNRQLKAALFALAITAAPLASTPPPAAAAEPAAAGAKSAFRAQIQKFTDSIATVSHGIVHWAGSDPYQIQSQGKSLLVVITHARLAIEAEHRHVEIALSPITIRRTVQPDGKTIDFAISPPEKITFKGPGPSGAAALATITLKQPKIDVLIDSANRLTQASSVSFTGARVDFPATGAWIRSGPLSAESKIVDAPKGGWRGPFDFELKRIEFFSPKRAVGGTIAQISYQGKSAGRSRAALEKLRLALNKLRSQAATHKPDFTAVLAALSNLPDAIGSFGVDLRIGAVAVHGPTGESLGSLKNVDLALKVAGIDGKATSLRLTLRQDGLLLPVARAAGAPVPHHIVVDLGIENLNNRALGDILKAATAVPLEGKSSPRLTQQQRQQLLGAAAMLEPVFRIYDVAVDTQDVGLDLSGQASGSPLSPKGYSAAADLVVRGFDAIAGLHPAPRLAKYLPLLHTMAIAEKAADGTPRLRFHIASGPKHWITINGNDVHTWFGAQPGQPRLLRLQSPPLQGPDVKQVQQALAAAKIPAPETGTYGGATAAAVARFQKEKGLNVDGVVDAATRAKLGIKPPAAPKTRP